MATPATNNRKIGNLYANLTPQERVRLMARLFREHNPEEMRRLRDATPTEHADAYNRALGLLRVLSSHVRDWITAFHLGMERDRLMLQLVALDSSHRWLTHARLADVWKLVAYPVTESEYRAIVELERSELEPLEDYAERLAGHNGTEAGLHPDIAALLQSLPEDLVRLSVPDTHKLGDHVAPDLLAEDTRRADEIAARIRHVMDAAIQRGELPEPQYKDDELCLPVGVLRDWGEGTTPETFELFGPGFYVPTLGILFGGDFGAKWEIRPDSDADAVRERRGELLKAFLSLAGVLRTERDALPSLDPPLTRAERERAEKLADELHDAWQDRNQSTEAAVAAARSHASQRAQLYAIAAAIETIQRDDFGGEDPLSPEIREALEAALTEATQVQAVWENLNSAGSSFRIREAMGLPRGQLIHKEATADEPDPLPELAPAPLPEEEPDVAMAVDLIRHWGEPA